jgi:hypothetical protein
MTGRLVILCALLVGVGACDRDAQSKLKGQRNTPLTFHGLTVDQDGKPLQGVEFVIEIESIPKNWTFESRGKPHEFSTVTATSDAAGRFVIDVVGHKLRFKQVSMAGYDHFYDTDMHDRAIRNMYYGLNGWGDVLYKSDSENPAVYVFVRKGADTVSVLPCRGGFDGRNKNWRKNEPGWPLRPSLANVAPAPSTTGPGSRTGAGTATPHQTMIRQ